MEGKFRRREGGQKSDCQTERGFGQGKARVGGVHSGLVSEAQSALFPLIVDKRVVIGVEKDFGREGEPGCSLQKIERERRTHRGEPARKYLSEL